MIVCTHVESGCNYPEGDCLGFCDNSWQSSRCPHAVKAHDVEIGERWRVMREEIVKQWLKDIESKESVNNVV